MFVSRVLSRFSRNNLNHCRSILASSRQEHLPILSNYFHSLLDSTANWVPSKLTLLNHSVLNGSATHRFGIATSASSQHTEKETNQSGNENGTAVENNNTSVNAETAKTSGDTKAPEQMEDTVEDLSIDDLMKLVVEKEELLKLKHKEVEKMQELVLRSYAEMENVMERTRREAENSKKYAIQNFAKALLDVADNLERGSSVVKDSFSKIDQSKDTVGVVPILKTLLEGVDMTEKQLQEVFRKFGMEKFDPINEQFDPHRHNAVFQIPDGSKPPGTVAVVLKPGYMLYDRVIRPADVGVTITLDNNEANQSSGS